MIEFFVLVAQMRRAVRQFNVKIVRQFLKVACSLVMVALAISEGRADTSVTDPHVHTQTVQPGQSYVNVYPNADEYFDAGGFCKVIRVGDLSGFSPSADSVPVFVPGLGEQWENYRTSAPRNYNGQLTSTTCCRPQANLGTLCAGGSPVQPVGREYGKLGETDQVFARCIDIRGQQYIDTITFTCRGYIDPNNPVDPAGPDGQAAWSNASETCTDTPWTSTCNAVCSGGATASGTTTSYDFPAGCPFRRAVVPSVAVRNLPPTVATSRAPATSRIAAAGSRPVRCRRGNAACPPSIPVAPVPASAGTRTT